MVEEKARALQVAAYRYNCQPCKTRKTKCDRVKPCASCQLRGTQDKCYSDEQDAAAAAAANGGSVRPPKRPRISQPQEASASGSDQAAIREHIASLRRTIDDLEALLPTSSSSAAKHSGDSSFVARSPSSTPSDNDEPILTNNLQLTWTDVAHLFPPQRDVERILSYFLREMVYIMIPVQEKQFWRAWQTLIRPPHSPSSSDDSQQGISRCMVGSLLFCLASTSFLIPEQREEEMGLSRPMAEQRDAWMTSALALVKSGVVLSGNKDLPWMHYLDLLPETTLDRFGFETLAVRTFSLLGSELGYHINGECLRRAIRINFFDESSAKALEAITYDDPHLTPADVFQMRRRIGAQSVVIERWTSMYAARPPIIDSEADLLPPPEEEWWTDLEKLTLGFTKYVSQIRLLPAQLNALTSRKAGDWATQRARDQEAVGRILELDRGLCSMYDPSLSRAKLNGRSHAQVLSDLPALLERGEHLSMPVEEVGLMHREFASALISTTSWLSLRCLITSNLMFLPWVGDPGLRYYALNLARRVVEHLPNIWMMATSPYAPFSSSWISRHLFLACTVLSIPILSQEPSSTAPTSEGEGGEFAPSSMQRSLFPMLHSKMLPSTTPATPALAASVDMDWFSNKLVESASLFSRLAERGDQTAAINTRLIRALLNSREELRGRMLDRLGEKSKPAGEGEGVGKIESQKDLTTFVMAASIGKSSPSTGASPQSEKSRSKRRGGGGGGGGSVGSPSLHDLANAASGATPPTPSTNLPPTNTAAAGGAMGSWWQNPTSVFDGSIFPSTPGANGGAGDVLANVPLMLDTHDWLAILDGVDIPL